MSNEFWVFVRNSKHIIYEEKHMRKPKDLFYGTYGREWNKKKLDSKRKYTGGRKGMIIEFTNHFKEVTLWNDIEKKAYENVSVKDFKRSLIVKRDMLMFK